MTDHGTTLSKLMAGRKTAKGTTEERVNKFKGDLNKFKDNPGQAVGSLLSGLFGGNTKKSVFSPKDVLAKFKSDNHDRPSFGRGGKSSHAKTASGGESIHAKTKSAAPNVGDAKSGARKVKTVTIAAPGAGTKSKPEAKKPAAAKPDTETNKRNKVSAARRKQHRKSSDSKYSELPGGKFSFLGAINRQLTGK